MILVVGGLGAGKQAFVRETLGYSRDEIAPGKLDERPVVADAQELTWTMEAARLLPRLLEKQVVICNEVGCGIVPMEAEDRQWREDVGRLCCALAAEATAVVRVCCGIPTLLKGTL